MEHEYAMIGATIRRVCITALAGLIAAVPADAQIFENIPAPNVELRAARGPRVRLADFKGKVVLVEFWASWCPDCHLSFPALDAIQREFQSKGVEVIAINVHEERKNADAFLKGRQPQLRVMFDPRLRAWDAFGALGVPTSFVIDRRGIIRYMHEGFDKETDAAYRRQIATLLAEPPP
jgi:peroxiredoxin